MAESIVSRMRKALPEAMKAKDTVKLNFLRYWIAKLTQGDGTEVSDDEAIKRMKGVLKEAKGGLTSFSPEEIELIRQWVPANLTIEQIEEALAPVAQAIAAAPKEGMAMGQAMKVLAGKDVDSDDVKTVVARIRQASA
ncbi:hypothetical protein Isop_2603 [Isosphaera pallida ATCC 43644]|uniref:GatB/YqeY domain-containing protein n=1 Tax=Isosphaera pallida (strain ATCC 43644 / DSM 9630 / IS1B) TaxID=575540 RepID=E8QZ31_ISOPI|nr:GatB/YqeY domain-containing protein [Isosphaera pallida]ADV63173.1 hypothetical protein Isop_2603 [Isosphaera pallida ATCC 43644]